MSKLGLVVKREFSTRVSKKSFIIISILSPILLGLVIMAPILINKSNFTTTHVLIFDETTIIGDILVEHNSTTNINYHHAPVDLNLDELTERYDEINDTVVLHIPKNFIKNSNPVVQVFNRNSPGLFLITSIKTDLLDIRKKLIVYSTLKLDLQDFEKRIDTDVMVVFQGEGLNPQMKFYLSFSSAMLLYLLIMIYGVQVLKGVQEEKNSRIIEIMISSVKPKILLQGKIVGIGLVGILQFFIIIISTVILVSVANSYFDVDADVFQNQMQLIDATGEAVQQETNNTAVPVFNKTIVAYIYNLASFLPLFLIVIPILFLGGYFLYASFFAAVGSALDSESDSQSMIFPITLPIIISILIGLNVVQNPNSSLAFWTSIFPLTSPIVMAARLPFINLETDWWQILLSIVLLLLSIKWGMQFAARVYKTGILMYGQKPSYKTIWKWFKQSKS